MWGLGEVKIWRHKTKKHSLWLLESKHYPVGEVPAFVRDVMLLAFKMGEGTTSQRMWEASRSWER